MTPDWGDTLALRAAGEKEGFLAVDIPAANQDPDLGGPLVAAPVPDDDALEAMTKTELLAEAAARGVAVDDKATKAELVDALRSA